MSKLGMALRRRGAVVGAAIKAKGDRAELLVLAALGRKTRPTWILSVRKGTHKEDMAGKDVIVETVDRGRLALQVKSSKSGARHFAKTHREAPIGVVIVAPGDDLNTVYGRALGALLLLREPSLRSLA